MSDKLLKKNYRDTSKFKHRSSLRKKYKLYEASLVKTVEAGELTIEEALFEGVLNVSRSGVMFLDDYRHTYELIKKHNDTEYQSSVAARLKKEIQDDFDRMFIDLYYNQKQRLRSHLEGRAYSITLLYSDLKDLSEMIHYANNNSDIHLTLEDCFDRYYVNNTLGRRIVRDETQSTVKSCVAENLIYPGDSIRAMKKLLDPQDLLSETFQLLKEGKPAWNDDFLLLNHDGVVKEVNYYDKLEWVTEV